jgi:D-alanine-D-alanine ligase
MRILVLGGGTSSEREVSQRSATAVREALVRLGHDVSYADPADGIEQVLAAAAKADVVFPILHGEGGEDGTIQRELDEAGVKYLGAGAEASARCHDKPKLKDLLKRHGIDVPAGETVTASTFLESSLTKKPFVLKGVDQGSSMGMLIARKLSYPRRRAADLLIRHRLMLLEELVEGIELTVAILGDTALPAIEIVPPQGEEFSYENKYNGHTAELCPPEHITPEQHEQAQRLAERVHLLAGVRHMSRTDMILTSDGRLVVLELNTIPGLTSQSLYPKAAQTAGMDFDQLVARLVEVATSG